MDSKNLSGLEKGEIARKSYLREKGIDYVEIDRTWVRQNDGKWLCISYSSEDKTQANSWSFAPAHWRVKECLDDGTLEGIILLCGIESGSIVDLRIGSDRLRTILPSLPVYDGYVWFTVRRRENGHFYLNGKLLR